MTIKFMKIRRKRKWLFVKDVENIVQTIIHIAGIAIICLENLLAWRQKEGMSVEYAEQQYMVGIIIA